MAVLPVRKNTFSAFKQIGRGSGFFKKSSADSRQSSPRRTRHKEFCLTALGQTNSKVRTSLNEKWFASDTERSPYMSMGIDSEFKNRNLGSLGKGEQ